MRKMTGCTEDHVVLVDELDRPRGTMAKMQAHRQGELHRAFSVFLFNRDGEMLLQRRAGGKYHSPGQWSNACCSHPRPGESVMAAARRRLYEELGIDCELEPAFSFTYRAEFDNGLTEHEFDHVLIGEYSGHPDPDPKEADACVYRNPRDIAEEMHAHPERFTPWFRHCFERARLSRRSGALSDNEPETERA